MQECNIRYLRPLRLTFLTRHSLRFRKHKQETTLICPLVFLPTSLRASLGLQPWENHQVANYGAEKLNASDVNDQTAKSEFFTQFPLSLIDYFPRS